MDAPTTSLSNDSTMDPPRAPFAPALDSPVVAHLEPTNLPLTKVQRAWDRRPQSPFSRQKVRFGKVWKRNPKPSSDATSIFGGLNALQAFGSDSPVKAVKKMRVDHGELVRDWDGRGSPNNRRIVTRSNRAEELVALDEEEPQDQGELAEQEGQEEEEEVLKIEIISEDGTIQDVSAQEDLEQEDWEDEGVNEDVEQDAVPDYAATIELTSHATTRRIEKETDSALPSPEDKRLSEEDAVTKDDSPSHGPQENATAPGLPELVSKPKLHFLPQQLPAGFVSPVKERRRRPISQVKQAYANRRRTLPVSFAAVETAATTVPEESQPAEEADVTDSTEHAEDATTADTQDETHSADQLLEDSTMHGDSAIENTADSIEELGGDEDENVNEWEDVDEEEGVEANQQELLIDMRDTTPEPMEEEPWIDTVENTPTQSPSRENAFAKSPAAPNERVAELASPSKLPSSPVPSITGPHPRLPLRRSPRRKSTSPLKQSSIQAASDRPHLIAFTPVKIPVYRSSEPETRIASSPLPTSPAPPQNEVSEEMGMPQPARSSSAPPEEPQISPRKPSQPRLSDDTALLQAFINRASESKNGRRLSTTARRESFENRRNSDAVRQALASPAATPAVTEVLGDLDPNSPSPRKQTNVESDAKPARHEEEDELSGQSPSKTVSRRSGRAKKKPETLPSTAYSGPNKISIRGSQESVILKRTEAQVLAQTTKNNTRKNKGGAVLPPLRLTRMAKEGTKGEESPEATMAVDNAGRKGIKWAETLVTFHEGASEPELSLMMDELSAPEADNESTGTDTGAASNVASAPEPAGNSRQRRLKSRKTTLQAPATTTPSTGKELEMATTQDQKPKMVTKKRSRIATPAKPKGGVITSGLPVQDAPSESKSTPAPKKQVVSKLPAPATSVTGAQGKENSLITSPPKKRTKAPSSLAPAPSAKTMPPTLDFTKSMGLEKKQAESANSVVPGLASPAKRSARVNVSFGEDGTVTRKDLPPSLGSPAKKRLRPRA